MQQPLAQQPDQMGTQQALGQQMVLCPVRLVYETQILVQPGDHIQPNQTFFINPQNPPPWMQNSLQNSLQTRQPMQNQVVYVHQLPNNIVSTIQQPIDQNQMYLQQNFPNFQIQQQMLPQHPQEMRPAVQLANIMPNMVQNIQTNVPNERTVQNRQIQANPQVIQNQIAVNRPVHNQVVTPGLEVQGQVFMRPQIQQQANIQRPMLNVNQMQNIQQQSMTNLQNVGPNTGQTFTPHTGRPGPNINPVRSTVANNIVNIQAVPKVRELPPSNVDKTVNSPIGNVAPNVRNFVPNYYRPIQPRPQIVHNVANVPKAPQHIPVQSIQNSLVYNHDKNNSHQNAANYTIIQELNNPSINRKRKSESPDDMQKKVANNSTLKHSYNTQNINKPNYNPAQESISKPNYFTIQHSVNAATKLVNEIGTNTSPVHRPKINPQFQMNNPQVVKGNDDSELNLNKEVTTLQDKDKLIRNTVYTQARGRVLQDKTEEIKVQQIEIAIENIEQPKLAEEKTSEPELQTVTDIKIIPMEIVEQISETSAEVDTAVAKTVKETNKNEENVQKNIQETLETDTKLVVKVELPVKNDQVKNELSDTEKMDEENKETALVSVRNTVKHEHIDILTHVVDGYVIQESNIAFPIRKPLKEKTLLTNMKSAGSEKKDLLKESIREELKSNAVDIPLLPFHYLLLESAKEEKEKAEEKEREEAKAREDPFSQLQQSTVKTWTVDDLSDHLLKFNWKETVSLLQDHEIDGESLFLVSKPQLLTIGVTEEHADAICEFVKS